MSWLLCNSCLMKPKQLKDRVFKLTSCGHIFCSSCIEGDDRGICPLCRSETRMINLSEEIDSSIKEYFSPADEMLSRTLNILKFQNSQQGIIQHNFHQMRSKYEELKQKYESAKIEIRKLYESISIKDNRIRNLENELANVDKKKLTPNINLSLSNSEPRTHLSRTRLSLPFHTPSPKSPQTKNIPWQSNSIIGSASRTTPSPNRFIPYGWQNMKRSNSSLPLVPPSPSPTGILSQNLNRLTIPSPSTPSALSQQNKWRQSNGNSRFSIPTNLRRFL